MYLVESETGVLRFLGCLRLEPLLPTDWMQSVRVGHHNSVSGYLSYDEVLKDAVPSAIAEGETDRR